MSNEQKIHAMVQELTPTIIEWRRDFHKYPESGWTEFRTTAIIAKRMMELGFTVIMGRDSLSGPDRMGVPSEAVLDKHLERAVEQGADKDLVEKMRGGYTGLWADMVCGTGKGPFIAIRFDIDANDCSECMDAGHFPADKGFASVNPVVMHSCGHDGHAAMGMAVAEIIAKYKDEMNGKVRLMFQPAEEGVRGAYPMVKAGVVDGVDIVLGVHIGVSANTLGTFVCGCHGFLATTKMDADFTGKSAHAGASPEEGRNALLAAAAAATNLHAISRHSGGATRITVGKMIAGQGRNVIPPNATLVMETRGATTELNEYMEGEANRIIKAAAEMWGCTSSVKKMGASANAASDPEIASLLESVAKDMGGYDDIIFNDICSGSDDFTYMLSAVQQQGGKGSYCLVGSPLKASHHNDKFDYEEEVLPKSVELLTRAIWKALGK